MDEKPTPHRAFSEKSYSGTAPGFQDYSAEEIKEIRGQYAAMIALVNYEVGRILTALVAVEKTENTLVVFTTDHGEMLGNHRQLLKGPQLNDDLTRVPLIARWPGNISAQTTMLRYKNWKLIIWRGHPACGNTRDGEPYDLANDPTGLHNLFHAPAHAKQRRLMKDMMLVAMTQAEDQTEPR